MHFEMHCMHLHRDALQSAVGSASVLSQIFGCTLGCMHALAYAPMHLHASLQLALVQLAFESASGMHCMHFGMLAASAAPSSMHACMQCIRQC